MKNFSRPNLEISLEEVMRNDFFVLKHSDTLSEACCLVLIQKAKEIIIVDDENKFIGIIKNTSILSKIPPPLEEVPVRYQINNANARKQIINYIINTGKRAVGNVFKLGKSERIFYKTQTLSAALAELERLYKSYTKPRIIPIINEDRTVAGIVSDKEVLEYIKNAPFLLELKIENLLSKAITQELIPPLFSDDILAHADFAMDYLPLEYIPICDSTNNLLGMVSKLQVSALVH